MDFAKPHFLLFCDASVTSQAQSDTDPVGGRWHFVLERIDAQARLEAADGERATPRERLSLLAVVRGLEALEEPSQVTLVTTSRYVARGLRYGLSEWRETGYIWEHFGVQKPIRNADLWQRIDGAMRYHEVACRLLESSLAQQVATVAEEVPTSSESLRLEERQADQAARGSLIPAPHFRIRERGPAAQPEPEPDWTADEVKPLVQPLVEQPLRRAASVRSVPRSHLQGRESSWWQLAAGWLGRRHGRQAGSGRWRGLSSSLSG